MISAPADDSICLEITARQASPFYPGIRTSFSPVHINHGRAHRRADIELGRETGFIDQVQPYGLYSRYGGNSTVRKIRISDFDSRKGRGVNRNTPLLGQEGMIAMNPGWLPLVPEDVTAEWLGQALADRYPGTRVESLDVTDILWGTGTKMMATARYNDAGRAHGLPEQLCIKAGLAEHRELVKFCYQTEARFFAELAPCLSLGLPHVLYAGCNGEQGMVVMEDLRAAGARICRVQEPLTREQAAAFLDDLAALHARWWNSPELADEGDLGWLMRHDPLPDEAWGDFGRGQLLPDTWAHYMSLPRALAIPSACRNRETIHAALQALRLFGEEGPRCVVHGDAHLGNMFIRRDGRPGFLDWQTARRGHWAHDLTYFYVSALDPLDRRAWEKDLIAGYLAALAAHGVPNPPSHAEALRAIRAHIVYGLFYWMVNPVEWQVEENNAATASRFAWAAVDLDAPPVGPL